MSEMTDAIQSYAKRAAISVWRQGGRCCPSCENIRRSLIKSGESDLDASLLAELSLVVQNIAEIPQARAILRLEYALERRNALGPIKRRSQHKGDLSDFGLEREMQRAGTIH